MAGKITSPEFFTMLAGLLISAAAIIGALNAPLDAVYVGILGLTSAQMGTTIALIDGGGA